MTMSNTSYLLQLQILDITESRRFACTSKVSVSYIVISDLSSLILSIIKISNESLLYSDDYCRTINNVFTSKSRHASLHKSDLPHSSLLSVTITKIPRLSISAMIGSQMSRSDFLISGVN